MQVIMDGEYAYYAPLAAMIMYAKDPEGRIALLFDATDHVNYYEDEQRLVDLYNQQVHDLKEGNFLVVGLRRDRVDRWEALKSYLSGEKVLCIILDKPNLPADWNERITKSLKGEFSQLIEINPYESSRIIRI